MPRKEYKKDILPKYYGQTFLTVERDNNYYSIDDEYLLVDLYSNPHGIIKLVDKQVKLVSELTELESNLDKNCDLEIYNAILKNYNFTENTLVNVLTFKNLSYPYLEIQNFIPNLLRQN